MPASSGETVNALAGQISSISGALRTLGIDFNSLQTTAAAFQLIGGSAQILKGIIAAKQAYNAARAAEGIAHLAKYGPYAPAVAVTALSAGLVMGAAIDRVVNVPDTDAGVRALIGGVANGTRY